jgi:hypothetical protein
MRELIESECNGHREGGASFFRASLSIVVLAGTSFDSYPARDMNRCPTEAGG